MQRITYINKQKSQITKHPGKSSTRQRNCCREHDGGDDVKNRRGLAATAGGCGGLGRLRPGSSCVHQHTLVSSASLHLTHLLDCYKICTMQVRLSSQHTVRTARYYAEYVPAAGAAGTDADAGLAGVVDGAGIAGVVDGAAGGGGTGGTPTAACKKTTSLAIDESTHSRLA